MHSQFQPEPGQPSKHVAARRGPRYPVDLPLRVQVATPARNEFMLGHGRDVSHGGMAIYIPVELETGDAVLVELIFSTPPEILTLRAEIKNRMGFKYGVEFIRPSPEQQQVLLARLEKLAASAKVNEVR